MSDYIKIKNVFLLAQILILGSYFSLGSTVFAEKYFYESYIASNEDKIVLEGASPGEQFGSEIAYGDINNDGIDDLIIGSPFFSYEDREWNGKVSLIYGGKSFASGENLNVGRQFLGAYSGDQLGTSLAIGDYNGDSIDDIAMGAYNAFETSGRPGKVYVVYGHVDNDVDNEPDNVDSAIDNIDTEVDKQVDIVSTQVTTQTHDFLINKPDLTLVGEKNGEDFGLSISAFDINMDSVMDLGVGAPAASGSVTENGGAAYIYVGGETGLKKLFTLRGRQTGGRFGASIAAGKILNQDYMSLAVGAYSANGEMTSKVGKVFIYDLSPGHSLYDPELTITGTEENGWFSFALRVIDLNNDGYDDILASTFPYLNRDLTGKISILYGGNTLESWGDEIFDTNELINTQEKSIFGDYLFGSDIFIDDMNNDGNLDLLVGAPAVGRPISSNEGDLYIFYEWGQDALFSVIHGEKPDDWFSYSLTVLDFNGDSFKDLAIGSRYSDTENGDDNGKVFIVLGDAEPFGLQKESVSGRDLIKRGDFIKLIVKKFDLKAKEEDLIENCYAHKEFCFFNFTAMSLFKDISLEPELILYPDVAPADDYYESVTIATILNLTNGYIESENSPFYPNRYMTRIEALKIILKAAELVSTKERFEIPKVQNSKFLDVDPNIFHMWWYPRYVNFAVENDIIDSGDYFWPDDNVTFVEVTDMINRTINFMNSNEKTEPSGNSQE